MKRGHLRVVLALVTGCAVQAPSGSPNDAGAPRKAPDTLLLSALQVPRALSYVGTVIAPHDAVVSSTRGGRVDAYYFEVGQAVHAGDLLVKLGAAELTYASQAAAAGVKQARARIAGAKDAASLPSALAAKSSFEVARDGRERAERLFSQGSLSEQALNRARADEAAAKAQYEGALASAEAEFGRLSELEAASAQAQAALGDKAVRAPFDGVVLDRFIEVGQIAAPNGPLVRVIDPQELRLRFFVPQLDAAKVKLGSKVTLELAGRTLTADVVRTTPGLVGEANARLVEARIALPPDLDEAAQGELLPGSRHPLWLEIGGVDEVVKIPRSATTSGAGLLRAWVLEQNRLSERLLSVLRFAGDDVLVRGGLRAGERLVTHPEPSFRLGEEVTP